MTNTLNLQKKADNATLKLYGIKNCDTMKKAMTWLTEHGIAFELIDYKKPGVVAERLPQWTSQVSVDALLNRRGLMWKKLTDAEREDIDPPKAMKLMTDYPVLVKRPVLEIVKTGDTSETILVGFDINSYTQHLAND